VRYDAAIIGAGTNGLAAAAALSGVGLKTIVLERSERAGGRCTTREFHPGFRASPYCDEIAPVPADIFRALDLARHGAIFSLAPPDRFRRAEILARGFADTALVPKRRWFERAREPLPWPGRNWFHRSLDEVLDEACADEVECALARARALSGRSADPSMPGTALHLLAPGFGGSGVVTGGLARLAGALEKAARAAGAEITLGLEVADIRHHKRRASGVRLADGTEIEARAVISTLDLRRTFFSLFAWKDLARPVAGRVASFRPTGAAARLLLALDAPPDGLGEAPLHSPCDYAKAHAAWQSGAVPERPPLTLRLVSAQDPSLAPQGKAVLTATLGAIPHHLFDGPWTNEKRTALRARVLADIDALVPGTAARVLAAELILPPDIEEALGITEGDLGGGEIAPDQMFAARGFADCTGGRTPVAGLYLGGRSSPLGPFASCAAGIAASRALMADLA
jgi:phytoene dehydrogenase-like protein